jgi:hypothetical protein
MQIEIPNSNNGNEWTRLQFERWLRTNVASKGNAFLIKFAIRFLLMPDYAYVVPNVVLIHFILDRLLKDDCGVAIQGELFGLLGSKVKKGPTEDTKYYKLKGLETPHADIDEFMATFTKRLAHFVAHEFAEEPLETDGVDLDKLHDILGKRGSPQYILPTPPPPLHALKSGGRDPSKKTKTKRVVESELDNLNADVKDIRERQEKHDFILQHLDKRLAFLENK